MNTKTMNDLIQALETAPLHTVISVYKRLSADDQMLAKEAVQARAAKELA